MKRIRNILYLIVAVLGISIPFQALAAGQDTVTLTQEGENVDVLLAMSDAEKENITAVSVSLQISAQDSGQIAVDFEFSPELGNGEYGFKYKENGDNTGRLDIYAATGTAKSLFSENGLDLGSLKITSKDPSQTIPVTISYYDGSFQTANAAYGSKTPMVEQETASVSMQIGNGTVTPPPQEEIPGTGDENQTPGTDGSGDGGSSGGSNMDDGLYDDTTQFTNDPSNAQKIPSSIIQKENMVQGLTDLSAMAGQPGNKLMVNKNSAKTEGKVSIVAPKDGMDSILVSKTENNDSYSETGNVEDTQGLESNTTEIKLDKENGGIVGQHKSSLSKILPMVGLGIALILIIGCIIFAVVKMKDEDRRKRKRKKKKAAEQKRKKSARNRKRKKRHSTAV